ncbi:MAG TPA: DUF4180 domain-containing protein [Nocardioides sp.]|uniref:DUF4180 domain-containing protein n=1 Tax=Nocardioides sp. TaxID=35761 RepID=UPI002D7EC1C7|nr:DUF4180 domain-containing protein [Nocardioides sp.]HET6652352.1 DUF4180 domain-containing protein [Nocardioides sp.]
MTETTRGLTDSKVLVADTTPLHTLTDVVDLVGNASYQGVAWVAVPADLLPADFFRLRTGFAGEVMQKFVNYRVGLAVVGDISAHTQESTALADLVRESNAGTQIWFLPDLATLEGRLAR